MVNTIYIFFSLFLNGTDLDFRGVHIRVCPVSAGNHDATMES